jgi:putative NADPH-quinone reductase
MYNCLIVIADSNKESYTHKGILPTIQRFYKKRGWNVEVANLYRDGFDITNVDQSNVFIKSFKHQVKSANHIHFIPTVGFYGFSAAMLGFFQSILTENFAYSKNKKGLFKSTYKPLLAKKEVWFHISHTKTKATKLNFSWYKLKKKTIPAVFKDAKIMQYGIECLDKKVLYKKIKNITDELESKVKFKESE